MPRPDTNATGRRKPFIAKDGNKLMGKVLGIVQRVLSTHLINKAGFIRETAQTGTVTLIKRFGLALNLNLHYHMLVLDGV